MFDNPFIKRKKGEQRISTDFSTVSDAVGGGGDEAIASLCSLAAQLNIAILCSSSLSQNPH